MNRLLDKPLKTFILFTCIVLAGSIPVYFYLVESIWIEELDDHNQLILAQLRDNFAKSGPEELQKKIILWNDIQSTSRVMPASRIRGDSVYVVEREISDRGVPEMERFRGLNSTFLLNGKPYSITIETNVEEVDETVLAISLITCLFIALLISGFILLNRRLSKRIWKPFIDTLEKLKQFDLNSAGRIDFGTTDITEFAELNTALTKLIRNNIQVYTRQKEFTQNASHELQTPLALLKTRLDLLVQDATLTTQQRKIIESLDNSISRITRINKNLLLLAGIENKAYESEEVDLSGLVKNLAETFKNIVEDKRCTILPDIQAGSNVKANESLVEILITNLLSNTIRHGVPESVILIQLSDNLLTVSNKGTRALNEKNLFKRFISESPENPGTGLGLAIVKEICDKYNWRVGYSFSGDQHVFTVSFQS